MHRTSELVKISRRSQLRIARVLNDFLPPILRDARWFMRWPIRFVFGRHASLVMDFKHLAYEMTEDEIVAVYREVGSTLAHSRERPQCRMRGAGSG